MNISNESGRSMVEMLGVLAIIGVLSVGGIAGYSKAMNKYKINKTTDQVSMLVANIRTLFSTQGNYSGLDNQKAKEFGVVPNDMYTSTSDTTIKNAFKGNVYIKTSQARKNVAKSDAFLIAYDGLSAEACVTIATGDWGSGQASGLIGIAAGAATSGETLIGNVAQAAVSADASKGIAAQDAKDATGLGKVFVDDNTACGVSDTLVIAAPGGSGEVAATTTGGTSTKGAAVTTPISVTYAVRACSGNGSGNAVAWKYY